MSALKSVQSLYKWIQNNAPKHVHVPALYKNGGMTVAGLMLVYFVKNMGKICMKKDLMMYLEEFGISCSDPQPRHIGMQWGYEFLIHRSWHPRAKRTLKAGEYCLMAFKKASTFCALHRRGSVSNSTFRNLVKAYHCMCAVCGSKENEKHNKNESIITSLEKGHCDPTKPLNLDNCIPICKICNRAYKNKFCFNKNGMITKAIV
jgi:hypothetical protein